MKRLILIVWIVLLVAGVAAYVMQAELNRPYQDVQALSDTTLRQLHQAALTTRLEMWGRPEPAWLSALVGSVSAELERRQVQARG